MYEISRYTETNIGGTTTVIHLAAETGTGQSSILLDLLANEPHDVRRVLVASSRSAYGEGAYRSQDGRTVYPPHRSERDMAVGDFDVHMPGEQSTESIPTDEDAPLRPSSVYGITKQMQESLVMTVCPTIGIEPVSLRFKNVYGPGQSLRNPYTGILSIFSMLIHRGEAINIFEDGLESQNFVYIDDLVEATFIEATFHAATAPAAAGEVLNVGSGTATTVLDVVDLLFRAFGTEVPTVVSGNFRLGDIHHNVADISRLRNVLGYSASIAFSDGVARLSSDW